MIQNQDERFIAIEQQLTDLIERISQLEQQESEPAATPSSRANLRPDEIDFALLDRLYSRDGEPFASGGLKGSVAYAVAFQSKNDKLTRWYIESPVPTVLTSPVDPLAQIFIALGHAVRLQLVRFLLTEGPSERQQLQTALGIKSPGQLYFHLNSLLAAGLVVQLRRGVYEIEFGRVANLLVVLAATLELAKVIPEGNEASK